MRLISRLVGFALVILAAFWFTAANASETVTIDLVFVRIHASLPLVLSGSVLVGMGLSLFVGWLADRKAGRRTRELDVRDPKRAGWS